MGLNPVTLSLWTHTPAVAKLRLQPSTYICGNIAFLCLQPKPLCVSRGSSWPTEVGVARWKSRHRRGKHLHQHHLLLGSPLWCTTRQRDRRKIPVLDGLLPSSHLYTPACGSAHVWTWNTATHCIRVVSWEVGGPLLWSWTFAWHYMLFRCPTLTKTSNIISSQSVAFHRGTWYGLAGLSY